LSNELNTPKILFCPADADSFRTAAGTFGLGTANTVRYSGNTNLSFFVGVDAQETFPSMFLAGDHNMGSGAGGNPPADFGGGDAQGINISIGTNSAGNVLGWTSGGHQNQGNILLSDGSVQSLSSSRLRESMSQTGDSVHGSGGWTLAPGSTPNGANRLQFP
jgi:prepilin-type processing-associated H-X9-DG protein